MKHRILLLLLALACVLSLCGCGDRGASVVSSAPEEPQSFGHVPEGPMETTPVTGSAGEAADPQSSSAADSAKEDLTELAIQAVILCQASDQLSYSPDDPLYFWRAIGYLAGLIGDGSAVISEEDVAAYAGALFPLTLADSSQWPSLTEEDPLVTMEGSGYSVHLPELGELELSLEDPLGESSTSVQAELYQNGASLGTFSVSLGAYSGPDSGREKFDHSILGLESLS